MAHYVDCEQWVFLVLDKNQQSQYSGSTTIGRKTIGRTTVGRSQLGATTIGREDNWSYAELVENS